MSLIGSGVLKINGYSYPVFIDSMNCSIPDNHTEFSGSLAGIGEPDCPKPSRSFFDLFKSPDPSIEKVIFNDPATVVMWSDGTKTVVKCQPGDTYSKETGLALCIAKKYLGNKGNFNEVFKKWIPEEDAETGAINLERSGDIKVGDKVKVVRYGQTYSSYTDWVKRHVNKRADAVKWNSGHIMRDGDIGVVKYIAPHENGYEGDLAYIEIDGKCYVINIIGLKKVEDD